ncbi:hypothetical protein NXH76_14635 [Blautia schinkii]|nr:hypothetical protein [Blautia schinkii]
MPKINRIRIMNFSYNNDTREIPDEIFRFYDGENALLNLANGGGKTVLIQLFLQPILPDLKLQKRKMIDYFRKNSAPAYVMIEWLLDNPTVKDYLLTGIAIAPGNSMNTEESNRINYFTFASHYESACELDIQCVPFVRNEGERQVLLPFERARESVKKVVANHREMFYFGREDVGEYRKLLGQFGISQEEWRNIIARMNNDEGGITELFEKCSTSDSVLNEWIIKNIEKSQLAGQGENASIQDLLAGLVEDTLKNEEYIKAQKVIENYLEEQKGLEGELDSLRSALDQKSVVQNQMNAMYRALRVQGRNAGIDREELGGRQTELLAELCRIDQEEASQRCLEVLETLREAGEKESELHKALEEISKLLSDLRKERDCQEGARLLGEIHRLQGKISGLKQELEKSEGDESRKKRLKNLAYSLKLHSEKRYADLVKAGELLKEEIEKLLVLRDTLKEDESRDRKRLGNLQARSGMLRGRVQQFEKEQERVFCRLGFTLTRNILEQLDERETDKYARQLEEDFARAERQICQCETEISQGKERQKSLAQELENQIGICSRLERELEDARRELQTFLETMAQCEAELDKYGVDKELLYQKETLHTIFEEKMAMQKVWGYQVKSEEKQLEDMISGIQNHCVYLPETVIKAVEERDISYQTGEAYLQNLPEENRNQQLRRNPILPFGLILEKRDFGKLDTISFGDCYLRQIIPVFTYEQLGAEFVQEHQRVRLGEQGEFIAAYEEKIFSDAQREDYLKRLEAQKEELEKLIRQREEEETQLYQAKFMLENFSYEEGTEVSLREQVEHLEEQTAQGQQEQKRLNTEADNLKKELERLGELLPELQKFQKEAGEKLDCFRQFLEADAQYQKDFQEYSDTMKELKALEKRIEECENQLENSQKNENNLREQRVQNESSCREAQGIRDKYAQAEEAEILEESFQELEQEYLLLTEERQKNQAALQREIGDAGRELTRQKEQQEELEVPPEAYAHLEYRPERVRELKAEIKELEDRKTRTEQQYSEARIARAKVETDREYAWKHLRELGLDEPLDSSEIRQDYEHRRKNIRFESDKLKDQERALRRLQEECDSLQKRIRDAVPESSADGITVKLEENMEKQFLNFRAQYSQARKETERRKKLWSTRYQEVRSEFKGKNQCVEDILEALVKLPVEDPDLSFKTVHFYLQELRTKRVNLEKLLDYYCTQLDTISRTRNQIVDQCVSYGTGIYEEMKAIVQKSRIRLSQKSRPVQMLKLDIPKELDNKVRERMDEYIARSLQIMTDLNRKEDSQKEKKIREKLWTLTSGRELLNQVIGTNKIPVYVYKIDLNEKNSGLKRWEDAMAQNSGGEKFVVFFTLVSTLISYIREVTRRKSAGDAMLESKVLIMDNPFARTSSEHLLKAVMDIANTFRIQLICLSDLNQSSITNRFSLFYQLSVRKRMYSDKEVLKAGPVQSDRTGLVENEKLEHVRLYETEEQGDLWEWMEGL